MQLRKNSEVEDLPGECLFPEQALLDLPPDRLAPNWNTHLHREIIKTSAKCSLTKTKGEIWIAIRKTICIHTDKKNKLKMQLPLDFSGLNNYYCSLQVCSLSEKLRVAINVGKWVPFWNKDQINSDWWCVSRLFSLWDRQPRLIIQVCSLITLAARHCFKVMYQENMDWDRKCSFLCPWHDKNLLHV